MASMIHIKHLRCCWSGPANLRRTILVEVSQNGALQPLQTAVAHPRRNRKWEYLKLPYGRLPALDTVGAQIDDRVRLVSDPLDGLFAHAQGFKIGHQVCDLLPAEREVWHRLVRY